MATRRRNKVVKLGVVLRGTHCREECTLEIWEESSSTGMAVTRAAIAATPADLPDGFYKIMIGGQAAMAHRQKGTWLLSALPHGIQLGPSPRCGLTVPVPAVTSPRIDLRHHLLTTQGFPVWAVTS